MLPFQITRMFGLQSKTHGYALVSERGIQLVFRSAASINAQPDEVADSIMIEWSNLKHWKATRGYLADQLVLEVHVMIGEEPDGKNDNRLELDLQKRDREQLDRFEKHIQEYQSGKRKDDVEDVLDDVRNMLDNM